MDRLNLLRLAPGRSCDEADRATGFRGRCPISRLTVSKGSELCSRVSTTALHFFLRLRRVRSQNGAQHYNGPLKRPKMESKPRSRCEGGAFGRFLIFTESAFKRPGPGPGRGRGLFSVLRLSSSEKGVAWGSTLGVIGVKDVEIEYQGA